MVEERPVNVFDYGGGDYRLMIHIDGVPKYFPLTLEQVAHLSAKASRIITDEIRKRG